MKQKLFNIKKTFFAKDVKDAVRKERKMPVDEVWVDDEWKKQQDYKDPNSPDRKMGFSKNKI